MKVWAELVGVRKDLRLRNKWWHHLAVVVGVLSASIVYLAVGSVIAKRPFKLTKDNTYSMNLLRHAIGRQATTTIADLDSLGIVGNAAPNGELVPLKRAEGESVRCEGQARYKADDVVQVGGVSYRAIPDSAGQADTERRHCVASPAFASFVAESIEVYVPDGSDKRRQDARGFVAGGAVVLIWIVLYWNLYYRGIIPIYARRRKERRQRRFEQVRTR